MTQSAQRPPVGGSLGERTGAGLAPARRLRAPEPVWVAGIPALLTLAVTLYQVSHPSLWRDEGATLAAVHRSLPQLVRMLGNVDAVHSVYYLCMWFWVRAAGYGVVALRLPSAVGMAVSAGFTALIGRRLASARAGLAAGLVFAAIPTVTWYAQNAREYAIVGTIACVASYLLIRALDAPPGTRRRWLAGYGAALALLGLTSVLAFLLVPAHAVTVFLAHRRAARGGGGVQADGRGPAAGASRGLVGGWLAAVAAAGVVAGPLALVSKSQSSQVSWIKPPRAASFVSASRLIGHPELLVALVTVIAVAIVVPVLRGRRAAAGAPAGPSAGESSANAAAAAPDRRPGGLAAAWPGRLTGLAVPWLFLPFALLITLSLIHPFYQPRYLVYCIPAAALLAGAGLSALGWAGGAAGLAIIVAAAWPAQRDARHAASHGEDLRRLAHILTAQTRPGDDVLFAGRNTREFEAAYPAPYRRLRDVGLGRDAIESGTLTGVNAPTSVIRARLATVGRLWVVETGTARGSVPVLNGLGFSPARKWVVPGGIWLVLFTK